jgi:hypothetical protein
VVPAWPRALTSVYSDGGSSPSPPLTSLFCLLSSGHSGYSFSYLTCMLSFLVLSFSVPYCNRSPTPTAL